MYTIGVDMGIPLHILQEAKGIVFTTVYKAGLGLSVKGGVGIILIRLPDGSWSGPGSVGVGGVSFGPQVGFNLTESILILRSDKAVQAFKQGVSVSLGGDLTVAAGPTGRAANISAQFTDQTATSVYSYSFSRGVFAGVSVEGMVLGAKPKENARFYGDDSSGDSDPVPVSCAFIFDGLVEVPENPHYEALCTLLGGSTDLSAWPAFTEEASPLDDSFVFLDSKYYYPINPLFLSLSLSLWLSVCYVGLCI